jgi:hypothetical protein
MSSVRNYIDVIPSPKLVILEAQLVLDPVPLWTHDHDHNPTDPAFRPFVLAL